VVAGDLTNLHRAVKSPDASRRTSRVLVESLSSVLRIFVTLRQSYFSDFIGRDDEKLWLQMK
jgi:hypothetical protein